MAYVLYKVYGSTTAPTEDIIFNLQDAHGMLSTADYAAAIVAAFNNSESQVGAPGNEKGAVDAMFRDLLAADPLRFFDASGAQVPGLFEVNTDASSTGTWNIVDGDKIEVRTVFTFLNSVTLRTSSDVAQNLTPLPSQANDETVYIAAGSKLSIRLQITASDSAAGGGVDPANLVFIRAFGAAIEDGYVKIYFVYPISPDGAPATSFNIYNNGILAHSITDPTYVNSYNAQDPIPHLAIDVSDQPSGTIFDLTIRGVNSYGEGLPYSDRIILSIM
jgi:hypothetical protein